MKYVSGCLLLVSFFAFHPTFADESCECPKLACDSCSVERGITFFTDKCGPKNAKLKSCARPTCIPIEEPTKACPVPPQADSGPREPIVVKSDVAVEEAKGSDEKPVAGQVKVLQGSVSIVHADGKKSVVSGEAPVREGDTIESDKDAGAVVNFKGGNKLHVQPDSAVEVKEFKDPQSPENRKALLHLIKGKIRNQVEQKYNGKTSYYKVLTKTAVAGVRGTDFLVSHSEDGKLETKIETLGGKVVFSDLEEKEVREVRKGEGVTFTAPLPTNSDFAIAGKMGEVYKIHEELMAEIDRATRMDVLQAKRATASKESEICRKPKGLLNQCQWKCEGNPAEAKSCRTDLPQVRCVRSRCNANGEWAEETRLPASSHSSCPAQGFMVKDCDY